MTAFLRLLIVNLCLIVFYGVFLSSNIFAQATQSSQFKVNENYTFPTTVNSQSPMYANLVVNNLLHSFFCLMVGTSPMDQACVDYLHGVPIISQDNAQGGLLGLVLNLNNFVIINPPVRTGEYFASLGDSLGLVEDAHAQVSGSGAGVLDPILRLWQVSRNISYIVMIIIFVVIGLMVMFRQRLNPQTVITVQAALPGLVIGLIMITFSYFLASLITDVAFVGTNIVGYYFSVAQGNPPQDLVHDTASRSVLFIFGQFVGAIGQGDISSALSLVFNSMSEQVQGLLRIFAGMIAFQFGSSFGGPVGTIGGTAICATGIVTGPVAPFCGVLGSVVGTVTFGGILAGKAASDPPGTFAWALYFIAIAVLIWAMLRLLLRLITNYLSIIFLVVTAPFHFMIASLPGRQGIAIDWIRNMLCNVLAFPAVLAVFYFAAYLLGDPRQPFVISQQLRVTDSTALPLFGGLDISFLRILLVYGALLATPTIPDIICQAIGKIGREGQMIEQQISGLTREGRGYLNQAQGAVSGPAGGIMRSFETFTPRPTSDQSLGGLLRNSDNRFNNPFRRTGR